MDPCVLVELGNVGWKKGEEGKRKKMGWGRTVGWEKGEGDGKRSRVLIIDFGPNSFYYEIQS